MDRYVRIDYGHYGIGINSPGFIVQYLDDSRGPDYTPEVVNDEFFVNAWDAKEAILSYLTSMMMDSEAEQRAVNFDYAVGRAMLESDGEKRDLSAHSREKWDADMRRWIEHDLMVDSEGFDERDAHYQSLMDTRDALLRD